MTREYELKRRALQMEDTRQRIVEAAIELHQTVGPARTSVSAIAARAGIQRQTYYRHFPEQRSLFLACSGTYTERNPLPDPAAWRAIADPGERLHRGVAALYAYYAANEQMLVCVVRDAEIDPLTREMVETFVSPAMTELRSALAEGRDGSPSPWPEAALELAFDFHTWRLLTGRGGLSSREAAELVAGMVVCAGNSRTPGSADAYDVGERKRR